MYLQEQEAQRLEQQAEDVLKRPKNRKVYKYLCTICLVSLAYIFCTQELITKSSGFLGLPVYGVTGAFFVFIILLVLFYILGLIVLTTPNEEVAENTAKSLREQAQTIRNMSDLEFKQMQNKRKAMAAGKAAFKLGKMFLGG